MAIRKFNLLKTSEIAEAPFRSLQEIDDYLNQKMKEKLDEMDGLIRQYQLQFSRNEVKSSEDFFVINRDPDAPKRKTPGKFSVEKLDKVVIPRLDTLKQNFALVEEISEQVEALDTLYNTTALNFRGVRGAADILKNIKAMQRNFQMKMEKALSFLNAVGSKYEPSPFKELVQKTMSIVSEELEYKSLEQYLYGTVNADEDLQFTHFIELRGLVNDEGEIYPKFFLVFSCILKKSDEKNKVSPHYYVTVLREFATPGKFPLGRQVDSPARAMTVLGTMLDLENVGSGIGTIPHNIDPNKVNKNKFSMGSKVASLKVEADSFEFTLLKSVKGNDINDVVKSLWLECKTMITKVPKARLKVKMGKDKDGRVTVKFTVTNLASTDKISTHDIDFLKEHFGLDDTKLRRVIKVINED